MRVLRREHEAPQPVKIGMRKDELHESLGEALAAMRLDYEHVRQIAKGRVVGDHPGETHLTTPKENTEAKRTLYGAFDGCARYAGRPVALRQVGVDCSHVQAPLVRGDFVLVVCGWHLKDPGRRCKAYHPADNAGRGVS